jgi:hypothetical protein
MPEDYKLELQQRLDLIFGALSRAPFLAKILDREWYKTLSQEICQAHPDAPFHSDSALMFFELDHPLRGAPWFEKAQDCLEQGQEDKLDRKTRLHWLFLAWTP